MPEPASPRLVPITVQMPEEWIQNLEALVDPDHGLDDVAAVLAELADHAQQAVYRPGAWERGWLCQALGYEWLDDLEPDPEQPGVYQRPRRREPSIVPGEEGLSYASERDCEIDPIVQQIPASAKPRLTTTRTAGVLVDERGRMWAVDDARLPHSNRERGVCDGCGGKLGDLAYMEHRVDGVIRCAACVEVG